MDTSLPVHNCHFRSILAADGPMSLVFQLRPSPTWETLRARWLKRLPLFMLQQGLPVGREEAETLILDLARSETAEGRSWEGRSNGTSLTARSSAEYDKNYKISRSLRPKLKSEKGLQPGSRHDWVCSIWSFWRLKFSRSISFSNWKCASIMKMMDDDERKPSTWWQVLPINTPRMNLSPRCVHHMPLS